MPHMTFEHKRWTTRPGLEHLNESEPASEVRQLTRILRLDCVRMSLVEPDGEDRGSVIDV